MPTGFYHRGRRIWALVIGAAIAVWPIVVLGQAPPTSETSPPANPTAPAPGGESGQLAERLRKMEEANRRMEAINQKVLQQFEAISRQNQELSKRVEDLTRRLNTPATAVANAPAPRIATAAFSANDDQPGNGAAAGGAPAVGGDVTAPYLSESAARPSRFPPDSSGAGAPATMGGPISGGRDVTAPYLSESAARPSRPGVGGASDLSKLIGLNAYYDPQRYGYLLRSRDGEFELRFNGLLETDARIYSQVNQYPVVSDLDVPRMRLYFSGRMTKPIEYQLSLQRSTNSFDILNAYINFHYDDRFQVRFGRYKPPFTYEWYKMSIWEMSTPDRSPFANNFGPNRQIGLMGWGFLFKERLEYSVGIFDGPRNSYQDSNSSKDVMALLDYKPFYQTDSPLKNLGFGGSFDEGQQNNPAVPAVLRTSTSASSNLTTATSGDNVISVPFLAFNNNVRERGNRSLGELHATYFYKSLGLIGIWDFGNNDFSQTGSNSRPVHLPVGGYMVQGSYLLTGETRQRQTLVDPKHPFDIRKGKFGLGAFEVYCRYSALDIGRQVFTAGLADPNLWTNRMSMIDLGVNWYLNRYAKFYVDWEHAMFAQPVEYGNGLQTKSDLVWLRLQIYL